MKSCAFFLNYATYYRDILSCHKGIYRSHLLLGCFLKCLKMCKKRNKL
jgi:hypothetical protein